MIVQCDKCQTRFKIPDGKVTERGVKVRCTKCSNTFRVMRPQEEGASPPSASAPHSPVVIGAPPAAGPADLSSLFAGEEAAAPAPAPKPQSSVDLDFDFAPSIAEAPPGPTAPAGRESPFDGGGPGEGGGSGLHGLFDIPEPPPEAPPLAAVESRAAPPPPGPAKVALGRLRPAGKPGDARGLEEAPKAAGAARKVSGLVVNLSVSAALLAVVLAVGGVYLNEGKVELSAASVRRVGELFFPARQMVAVDVSNGLYDTGRGRPLFYVRGEVENRSGAQGKAKVRAEILDGAQLVRAAEAWAGEVPTPEQLYAVSSAEELASLSERLDRAAKEVRPGARIPFLVGFYEYPPDLTAYRLHVAVVNGP